MPQPHTGELVPSGQQLWTFDSNGNLIVAGSLYVGGVPDPTKPGPGQPLVPGTLVSGPPGGQATFFYLLPSGDTTGATDPARVQALINAGIRVTLGIGKFYGNIPVVLQVNGAQVHGFGGATASGNDASLDLGTTWVVTSTFSNPYSWSSLVTGAFVVIQKNPGAGSGGANPTSNQVSGVRITDLWIDARSSPAAVDGVACYGAIEAFQMERVGCYRVTGKAFPQYQDPSWSSNQFPDGQHLYSCLAQICHDHAFYGSYVDACLIDCHAQSSNLSGAGYGDGFYFNNGSNTRLISCRSDLNNNGFTFDSPSTLNTGQTYNDAFTLIGCGTQGNNVNGLNVINSSATGLSTRAPVWLAGCSFEGDGQNGGAGGGGAGIFVSGRNVVYGDAYVLVATQWAASGSPDYGVLTAKSGSSSVPPLSVRIVGGHLNGMVAGYSDAAPSQDFNLGPMVTTSVGVEGPTTGTLTQPNAARLAAASLSVIAASGNARGSLAQFTQQTSAPTSPGVNFTGAGSGDAAMGIIVSGDGSSRWRINHDGHQSWGPGNAAGDTGIQRGAPGRLDLSTTNTGGTFKPIDPYFGGRGFLEATSTLSIGSIPRASYTVNTAGLTTSGTVYMVAVYIPAGTTVTNITFMTGTGTLKTGGTHGWYVLCDSGRVVRAASADQTDAATVWGTASTPYPLTVTTDGTTKFVTTYGGLYYLGVMVANSGGTQPNLVAGPTIATNVAGSTVGSILCGAGTGGTGTGQTTPPLADGTVTIGAINADGTKNVLAWVT